MLMDYSSMQFTARNDYAFKKLFGNNENKDITKRFLSLILNIKESDIKELIFKNPFVGGNYLDEKQGIIDIKLELNQNIINIEMQNFWHSHYEERVLFTWSNSYTEELNKGHNYGELKKCISINIINSKFPYSDDIHSIYKILNIKDKSSFKDLLELHFLDLTKLNHSIDSLNELERWLLFIQTEENEIRENVSKGDKAMEKAGIVMKEFYSDPKERMLYTAIFMEECEKTTLFEQGKNEGRNEGIVIGENKGMANIVLFMNKKGMTIDEIENNTGIDKETILSFIEQDKNIVS